MRSNVSYEQVGTTARALLLPLDSSNQRVPGLDSSSFTYELYDVLAATSDIGYYASNSAYARSSVAYLEDADTTYPECARTEYCASDDVFDGNICEKCYYQQYNDVLDGLTRPLEHIWHV